MDTTRWGRRLAWAAAVGLAAGSLAVVHAPSAAVGLAAGSLAVVHAPSAAAADGPGVYAGGAEASGVDFSIDSKPAFAPIPDFIHLRTPAGISSIDSAGSTSGTASLLHPGGAGELPGALCQVGFPCQEGFPPPYPLNATASYPGDGGEKVTAQASGQPVGGDQAPFLLEPAKAAARALQDEVWTDASTASVKGLSGLPVALSVGTGEARTHQYVKGDAFVTEAVSTVHDVSVAELIHIDAVQSRVLVSNDGQGHISKKASATVTGVTVAGHPATIDEDGISIDGQGPGGAALKELNDGLRQALSVLGMSVRLVGVQTKTQDQGLTARAAGVLLGFERNVEGAPNLSQVPCLPIPDLPCVAPPNPNARYFGTLALGIATVTNVASPAPQFDFSGPDALPGATSPGGPSSGLVPGTPRTPGSSTSLPGLESGQQGTGGDDAALPKVAGSQPERTQAVSALDGVAGQLTWMFPALFLAGLAALAGRWRQPRWRRWLLTQFFSGAR